MVGRIEPFAAPGFHSVAERQGVPVDDACGEQIEARDPVVLALGGAVADLALATNAQGVLQGVLHFALVEADLRTALYPGIENPFDDEQCPLDAADLA